VTMNGVHGVCVSSGGLVLSLVFSFSIVLSVSMPFWEGMHDSVLLSALHRWYVLLHSVPEQSVNVFNHSLSMILLCFI
jgi:hypothetical protein